MALSTRKPIENIPDELLGGVFLLMVQEEAFDRLQPTKQGTGGSPQYPWLLARVCAHWRKICLENARLWSYINTICKKPSPSSLLAQANLQLERSGSAPLFINGYGPPKFHSLGEELFPTWKALSPHSSRWKDLRFAYGTEEGVEKTWRDCLQDNTGFANLTHVGFRSDLDTAKFSLPFPICNAGDLKTLRFLTLGLVPDLDETQDFPWHQLTCLNLEACRAPLISILKVLPKCTNLAHFDLSLITEEYEMTDFSDIVEEIEKDSVVLPNLLSFTMTDTEEVYVVCILSFLRLPSLRCLKVDLIDTSPSGFDSDQFVVDFLKRSSCPLTEFEFHWAGDEELLADILGMVPQVQILTIGDDIDDTLSVFGDPETSASLCPSLRRLTLNPSHLGGRGPGINNFTKMMETRMADPTIAASFKTLRIIYPVQTPKDQLNKFRSSLEQSMKKYTDNGFELSFFSAKSRYTWQPSDIATQDPDDYLVTPRIIHSHLS